MQLLHAPFRESTEGASLSEQIAGSWRRCCLEYSLDPARPYAPTVLDAAALTERCGRNAELLRIAAAEIDVVYDYIAQSGYALILTDASGVVLYRRTDPTLADAFQAAGLMSGADWSERRQGTNGIGTCIAENRPVIIQREEHFRACHTGLTCFGAPIHDPAGALLAVLDASTLNAPSAGATLEHTMALVDMTARAIEKRLFVQRFRQEILLRFHTRPELVDTQHDGAIALARDATIIAADDAALRLLDSSSRCDLIGRRIDEVFDVCARKIAEPARGAHTASQSVRETRLGKRFFVSLDYGNAEPETAGLLTRPAGSPRVIRLAPSGWRKSSLTLEELAGEDPQMLRNVRSAHRIATSRVPVMIQGPTGAGKEVFARALHAASDRAAAPFVALNCAAIPESLIESELFGYRSGAFTGARREGFKGKLLQSSGGTLFLDEIGDMPLLLQTRLLRVLEEQEVAPLGSETPVKVDLRVICASHQNLRA
ncbi:MAG TPA: sigma-54-dependent Fis family transcriptional regulator, partial [Steroidobacter sp.]|nr:sigma-54-dependent Fis family transcriptional regulator [Steroidobacter sp.]